MIEADLIVSGGTVLTMDERGARIPDGAVVIKGRDIVEVGKLSEIEKKYSGKILDTRNSIVMPGIVNCHTHAAMTCFRGIADDLQLEEWLNNYIFPAEAKNVNEELVYWGTKLACAEMIRSGTTTFCDMYICEDEAAKAAAEAGMRCLLGEVLFDFPSPNFQTPEEGLRYTRKFIEKWDGHPLIRTFVEPHSLYTCSFELLRSAKELADEYCVFYGTHYLETKVELSSLTAQFGMRPTDYLRDLGYLTERFLAFHCVWLDEKDIKFFAANGCKVAHNPESNMKLASGVALVPEMLDAGVTVGLGTDGCASNNNLDMFQEMDTAAKVHKVMRLDPTVMGAPAVVRMATIGGAGALGMDNITGSLEAGKRADLIVIPLNKPHLTPMYHEYSHLVYAAHAADVDTVIVDGKVLMQGRKLATIDENEAMERVREIAERVRKSINLK
ncbi:MAG: amidohydrolase [Syntrophaceae bacterium]